MMNVCWRLLLLFELITGDVIDANGDKSSARKQTLRANKSDQVTPSLDFGVLELGAYLERKTSPALVLANARDAFCHGSHCNYGHRENLIIRDNCTQEDWDVALAPCIGTLLFGDYGDGKQQTPSNSRGAYTYGPECERKM